jgi:hypothetical protein
MQQAAFVSDFALVRQQAGNSPRNRTLAGAIRAD